MRIATSTWRFNAEAFFPIRRTKFALGSAGEIAIALCVVLTLSNAHAVSDVCEVASGGPPPAAAPCVVDNSLVVGALREIKDALPHKGLVNKISLVEIDRLEADDFWAKAAFWLSLLSLVLSFGIPIWLFYRARAHSITDDYWIRQVGHDIVVSPIIVAMNWHTSQCEMIAASKYWDESATQLTKLRESLSIVPVFFEADHAKKVYDELIEGIARVEESVANFADLRLQIESGGSTLNPATVAAGHKSEVTAAFLSLLRILKRAQTKL